MNDSNDVYGDVIALPEGFSKAVHGTEEPYNPKHAEKLEQAMENFDKSFQPL